jgi:hypothetical protein
LRRQLQPGQIGIILSCGSGFIIRSLLGTGGRLLGKRGDFMLVQADKQHQQQERDRFSGFIRMESVPVERVE